MCSFFPCFPFPINQINLTRKTRQEEIGPKLGNLVRKRDETLYQNLELQKACAVLSREIKKMKTDAEASGIAIGGKEGKNDNDEEEEEDDVDGGI